MADQNPMGGGAIVSLDLPDPQVKILRSTLTTCLEGVRGDLETPERLDDPEKARREADAYERLLAGLDRGEIIVPDEPAQEAVEAMATSADEDNNYAEIVAEHVALYELLARLGGEEGGQ
jgi:hypothetical protein